MSKRTTETASPTGPATKELVWTMRAATALLALAAVMAALAAALMRDAFTASAQGVTQTPTATATATATATPTPLPLCERTFEVRRGVREYFYIRGRFIRSCHEVTLEDIAGVTRVDVRNAPSLAASDFRGMDSLTVLHLI